MSDAPVRARASAAKRAKPASMKRADAAKSNAVLQAEFDDMMERSSKTLAKLNADMDELLISLRSTRLTS